MYPTILSTTPFLAFMMRALWCHVRFIKSSSISVVYLNSWIILSMFFFSAFLSHFYHSLYWLHLLQTAIVLKIICIDNIPTNILPLHFCRSVYHRAMSVVSLVMRHVRACMYAVYRVAWKKTGTLNFVRLNFVKYWAIFKLISLSELRKYL